MLANGTHVRCIPAGCTIDECVAKVPESRTSRKVPVNFPTSHGLQDIHQPEFACPCNRPAPSAARSEPAILGLISKMAAVASSSQRLLDFSQPIDVPLLDATVNAFYGAASPSEVVQII